MYYKSCVPLPTNKIVFNGQRRTLENIYGLKQYIHQNSTPMLDDTSTTRFMYLGTNQRRIDTVNPLTVAGRVTSMDIVYAFIGIQCTGRLIETYHLNLDVFEIHIHKITSIDGMNVKLACYRWTCLVLGTCYG